MYVDDDPVHEQVYDSIIYMHRMQRRYLLACHACHMMQRLFVFIPSEKGVNDFSSQILYILHILYVIITVNGTTHRREKTFFFSFFRLNDRQVPENFKSFKDSIFMYIVASISLIPQKQILL